MCRSGGTFHFLTLLLTFDQSRMLLAFTRKKKKKKTKNGLIKDRRCAGNVTISRVVTELPHPTCTVSFNANLNEEDIWSPKCTVLKGHSVYLCSRTMWTARYVFHFSFCQSRRRENSGPRQAAENTEWLQNFCQLTATFTPSVQKAHAGRTVQSPARLLLFKIFFSSAHWG